MRRMLLLLLCLGLMVMPAAGTAGSRYVALTFDDGPSGKYTRRLLDGLAERDVKATFLLCGYRIRQYPQEAQRIAQEGHEIGNHGYSHKNMQSLGHREIAQEIMDTQALLPNGVSVRFLRPPGGCCNEAVRQVAKARGLAILSWSVDPRDWAVKDAATVEQTIFDQVQDGDIILLHDLSDSSVEAALAVIDKLQEEGYRFVTVSQLARLREVNILPGRSYQSFPEK